MTRHLATPLAVVVALWMAGSALAQSPLELDGYGGSFFQFARTGAWAERTVFVANRSDRPRRVKVAYLSTDAEGAQVLYSRIASIPPGCRREIRLCQKPAELPPTGREMLDLPRATIPLRLIDVDTGQQIQQRLVEVTALPEGETRVAVLQQAAGDARDPLDEADDIGYLEELPGDPLGGVRLLRMNLARRPYAPDRWVGYDAFRLVIVRRVELSQLGSAGLQALLDWTRRGGVLVLASSDTLGETLAGPLGRAAGATCYGGHRVEQVSVTTEQGPAGPIDLPWPATLSHLLADGADTINEINGLPLALRNRFGQGWVYTLALPIGALADDRLHDVWKAVGRSLQSIPPVDGGQFGPPSVRTLNEVAGRQAPSQAVAAGAVVLLAGVALATALVAGRRRRGELIWVAMVPACIALAILVFVLSAARSEPPRLSHVGLITRTGEQSARVQEAFAYFSGPRQTSPTFTSDTPRGIIRDTSRGAVTGLKRSEVLTDVQLQLPDLLVEPKSYATFHIDGQLATRGIEGSLTFGPDGLTGRLTNHLPAEVTPAVIYTQQRTYRLGPLPVGEREVRITPDDLLGPVRILTRADQMGRPDARDRAVGDFTGQLIADTIRNAFIGDLIARPGIGRRVTGRPVILGTLSPSLVNPVGDRELQRQGWSVVAWPLDLSAPPAGTPVLVPAGFIETVFSGTAIWNAYTQSFNESNYPAEVEMTAELPEVLTGLEEPTVTLRVDMAGPDRVLQVFGLTAGGERVAMGEHARPTGEVVFRIDQADRFRTRRGGFGFVLKVTSIDGQGVGRAGVKWQFKTIDVSVEGTAP